MTFETQDPDSFLPLPPAAFHILMVLAGGENHGYAIMQQIDRDTGGLFRIGPGTLYGTIKRMMKAGWIEEADERPDPELDDERRRYYRLTALGFKVSRAEAQRLAGMVNLARKSNLLDGLAISLG
jgi:DNA-binding PadR family transcriptional regulator